MSGSDCQQLFPEHYNQLGWGTVRTDQCQRPGGGGGEGEGASSELSIPTEAPDEIDHIHLRKRLSGGYSQQLDSPEMVHF